MKKAVALSYNADVPAPFITGRGSGRIAERILEIAADHNIPVVSDDILSNTLFLLNPGDYIPEEVYGIVAEIFIFIQEMQERR